MKREWPSDDELVRKTSYDRKELEREGYNAEMAHFRLEYVRLREAIGDLLRLVDERVGPSAYYAFQSLKEEDKK